MAQETREFWLAFLLVIYMLVVGIGAAALIVVNFPMEMNGKFTFSSDAQGNIYFFPFGMLRSPEQCFLLLALLAGITGSFLHGAQSLSSYLGNKAFRASWTVWYFLRPWIGGILGIAIYFAIRAGVVGGGVTMNPYVAVAYALLGGWFSKTTADKLQEVFETLLTTDQDRKRRDKLGVAQPSIDAIRPSPVSAGTTDIYVDGHNFMPGATALINDSTLDTEFVSEAELKVSLAKLAQRPAPGTTATVRIKNPERNNPTSEPKELKFM